MLIQRGSFDLCGSGCVACFAERLSDLMIDKERRASTINNCFLMRGADFECWIWGFRDLCEEFSLDNYMQRKVTCTNFRDET